MKIFRNVLLGALVLVLVLVGFGTWFVRNPWPQTSGTLAVPGLSAPVQVLRDKWGVPNIYAENERDLFMAQGYVHAQDRLWSMYFNQLTASGKLAEAIGEPGVDADRFLRTLGLRRGAEQEWANMDADSKALLQAYADGVNAFINTNRNKLPIEFTVLRYSPEPWTPVDSIVYGNLISLYLAGNYRLEFLRARLIAEIGEQKTRDLLPAFDPSTPFIIPDEVRGYEWMKGVPFAALDAPVQWVGDPAATWGSNNWVVAGNRTVSGKPILAGDAHMNLSMPSIWYMNGLHGGRFNSTGFTLPGVPSVIIGHNGKIAWAVTNLNPDVQDLYIEKLDDRANPTKYEYQGQWQDLEIIRDTLKVNGGESVPLNIYITRHGPIINEVVEDMKQAEPMAFKWAKLGDSQLFASLLKLNTAQNWEQFREALRTWHLPGQNFVYADTEGNIGYQMTSQIPIRAEQHSGLVPVPGWTGEYEWQGFIPYDELPFVYNPPRGFIATANNKVIGDDYPYKITEEWDPGYRAQRITELLEGNYRMDVATSQQMQADTYSIPAGNFRAYMLEIKPSNEEEARAIELLRNWDLHFEADTVAGTIFQTWYWFIFQNTLRDDMSETLAKDYLDGQYERHGRFHITAMTQIIRDPNNSWFDDKKTPQVETRDEIMQRSLGQALNWLKENHGTDTNGWRWGNVHQVSYVSLLARSGNPLFVWLYGVPPIEARGENFSINTGTFTFQDPFSMAHGASQREVIDMSDIDGMQAIHSTGQSGLVRHANRTDMIEMWEDVQYIPVPFSREKVEQNAAATLTLTPEGSR
ncbi:MAG: penicillin acylase family protein [Chloroflexaceae bacterium]|jgi:penicillin amidase|nr:penicillin acylase family protein [Chloroflexaceae bacterium]